MYIRNYFNAYVCHSFAGKAYVGCKVKANCPLVGPEPVGKCPPWRSFQGILARIYASFGENQGKF